MYVYIEKMHIIVNIIKINLVSLLFARYENLKNTLRLKFCSIRTRFTK